MHPIVQLLGIGNLLDLTQILPIEGKQKLLKDKVHWEPLSLQSCSVK